MKILQKKLTYSLGLPNMFCEVFPFHKRAARNVFKFQFAWILIVDVNLNMLLICQSIRGLRLPGWEEVQVISCPRQCVRYLSNNNCPLSLMKERLIYSNKWEETLARQVWGMEGLGCHGPCSAPWLWGAFSWLPSRHAWVGPVILSLRDAHMQMQERRLWPK